MRKLYKVTGNWGGGERWVKYELHSEESAFDRDDDIGVFTVSSVNPGTIRMSELKNLKLSELLELMGGYNHER